MLPRVLCVVVLLGTAVSRPLSADENPQPVPVTITLNNGRTATGFVDSRTTEQELWIRRIEPAIVLRNGYDWSRVTAVSYQGKSYSPEEFRRIASDLGTQLTKEFWSNFWTTEIAVVPAPMSTPPALNLPSPLEPVSTPFPGPPEILAPPVPMQAAPANPVPPAPVASLRIDARLANWDNDPEPDGLLVAVTPFDPLGQPVAASGQIQFTLIGQNVSYGTYFWDRTYGADNRRPLFQTLVRQSYLVHAADFASGSAIYTVPFRTYFPQVNYEIGSQALLTARLLIPGQGAVQASDDQINIRPPNWIRDERQEYLGQRYFPEERPRQHPQ